MYKDKYVITLKEGRHQIVISSGDNDTTITLSPKLFQIFFAIASKSKDGKWAQLRDIAPKVDGWMSMKEGKTNKSDVYLSGRIVVLRDCLGQWKFLVEEKRGFGYRVGLQPENIRWGLD